MNEIEVETTHHQGQYLMPRLVSCLALVAAYWLAGGPALAQNPGKGAWWPQFRGPNSLGVSLEEKKLPIHFGPDRNVLWKTPLPAGHSSPCVWGDRIVVTAFDKAAMKLETICLSRDDGKILWRRPVPTEKIENVHVAGSPAVATPVADGERIYAYFGSFGLLCYNFAGEEIWKLPLPLAASFQGTGASPVLAGELLLLHREFNPEPCLMGVERRTGAIAWKTPFKLASVAGPPDGYATPVVWRHNGVEEVVILSPTHIAAFSLKDGKERWSLPTTCTAACTPALGDGVLFVVSHQLGRDPGESDPMPSFEELLKKADKDGDGLISQSEFPDNLHIFQRPETSIKGAVTGVKVKWFFARLDRNGDGKLNKKEWEAFLAGYKMRRAFLGEPGLVAIRPDEGGAVAKSSVQWREKRALPEVPSPLHYRERVYLVKDGGIATCLEAKSGKVVYRERLGAPGAFFASPVAGDGKIYACSRGGMVVVLAAGDQLKVLARNNLGEDINATPAIVDGKLYIRTDAALYAFGE
jgi:outer membrane protein assembly factor BamB